MNLGEIHQYRSLRSFCIYFVFSISMNVFEYIFSGVLSFSNFFKLRSIFISGCNHGGCSCSLICEMGMVFGISQDSKAIGIQAKHD